MSEILFRNFQLLELCCGLLHQLSVTEIYDSFCHCVSCRFSEIHCCTVETMLSLSITKNWESGDGCHYSETEEFLPGCEISMFVGLIRLEVYIFLD